VWLAVCGAAIAGVTLFWLRVAAPTWTNSQWHARVRGDLMALTHKRPPAVRRGPWEFAVGWTLNLHDNCGRPPAAVEPGWRDGFTGELERRLAGPITLDDIEWVWDEYAGHTSDGRAYADRWRPTRAAAFLSAPPGSFGIPVE
jgi:hypothetical protein